MPIFRYRGYRPDGADVRGTIEATGPGDAAFRIRETGVLPSEVVESAPAAGKKALFKRDTSFLPSMTRRLSMLLSAGVPLMEALQSLADEYRGFHRELLVRLKESVSGGTSLAKALEEFDLFPDFYVSMVRSGEQSGLLDKVLVRLAEFLENQSALAAKIRSAMIYPLLMIGVSIVVLSFLFTFVIPKIAKIFTDAKSTLPVITLMLMFISNIFIKYWWALIGAALAVGAAVRGFIRRERALVDRLILRLPGNILQSLYYSRFARTLGFLIAGGLPLLKSLSLSAGSIGNRELEASVYNAERSIAEGQSLSASLNGFPPVFIQLVATGERSGRLSEALERAAESYENDFTLKVNQLVALFEPLMILIMGLVVGFIVLAVLLPMFQLNQLIK